MKKIVILFIDLYKLVFSNTLVFLFGGGCRFTPTCSEYSKEAVKRYGALKGTMLSIKRVLKCHPFSKASYCDHV
jgi:putative membrane protein insertion efficiency factor